MPVSPPLCKTWPRFVLFLFLTVWLLAGLYSVYRPLPQGLDMTGPERPVSGVEFLADVTYTDDSGQRQLEQSIFDAVLGMIEGAERLVLIDMFLFNDFQGDLAETHRDLSTELTEQLLRKRREHPDMPIVVVTDPFNTLYGGVESESFHQLEAAGIALTLTDLTELRDSNPLYAGLWRPFIQPWGNSEGSLLPNPVADGRVSVRSYLHLLNFKANHRKLVIADDGEDWAALVTSANPHDGSSAHGNVALRFKGPAVSDLFASERAVLEFSDSPVPEVGMAMPDFDPDLRLQVVTERSVERATLALIDEAKPGDRLDLAAFYLSDRDIVGALKRAQHRGVQLRVLLDPNKDAFGREKNGVPNRPVAHELTRAGVPVRWCATRGEQCHSKWLLWRSHSGEAAMLLGSTNFTRRNLHNLNLETSVVLSGASGARPLTQGADWFERRWHNRDGEHSLDYEDYADDSLWHRFLYRTMEATGLSTF